MHIIESFKAKAHQGFLNTLQHLDQDNQTEFTPSNLNQSSNPLIQQIDQPDEEQYHQLQFQYFASNPNPNKHKCVVCKKTNPKYTCPKCKIRYCSSDHYKTHNLFCTEKFFKAEVETLLKNTKVNKEQQRKMVQILKADQAERTQDNNELLTQTKVKEIDQHRLNYILSSLQKGQEVSLTEGQRKSFEAFLKEIQYLSLEGEGNTEGENPLFEEYTPFWTVEEGLQQYFMLQPMPVEQYNESKHKELIEYRRKASEELRKYLQTLAKGVSFKKTSIFVAYDLAQVAYIVALLYRSFNGQNLNPEFLDSFLLIYDNNLAKMLAQSHPATLVQLPTYEFPTILPLLWSRIGSLTQVELVNLLKSWLPLAVEDAKKILGNKYICLQALYRLIQTVKSANKDKSKSHILKKLQFLLVFASKVAFHPSQHLPSQFKQNQCEDLLSRILERDSLRQRSDLLAQQKQELGKQERINRLLHD